MCHYSIQKHKSSPSYFGETNMSCVYIYRKRFSIREYRKKPSVATMPKIPTGPVPFLVGWMHLTCQQPHIANIDYWTESQQCVTGHIISAAMKDSRCEALLAWVHNRNPKGALDSPHDAGASWHTGHFSPNWATFDLTGVQNVLVYFLDPSTKS